MLNTTHKHIWMEGFFPICWTPSSLDALLWSAPLAGYMNNNMACFSIFLEERRKNLVFDKRLETCLAIKQLNMWLDSCSQSWNHIGFLFLPTILSFLGSKSQVKAGGCKWDTRYIVIAAVGDDVEISALSLMRQANRQTSHSCFFRTPLAHRRKPNKMINVKT